jgi:hypothetical protein
MTLRNMHLKAVPTLPAAVWSQRLFTSSTRHEKVFEHKLLGALGEELMHRNVDLEVLHGETDLDGHDVVLEAGNILRHMQLKVMITGGARTDITVNTRLAAKPSACIVWLTYDPAGRNFSHIRWFGERPGQPLPNLGDKLARHTRANSQGVKAYREGHRVLSVGHFEVLEDMGQLVDRLFGMLPLDPLAYMLSRMEPEVAATEPWLAQVAAGDFVAIPEDIRWETSTYLAHLINGYRTLQLFSDQHADVFLQQQEEDQQRFGSWQGDALTLWTTLFVAARAEHFGVYDHGARPPRFDQLCQQLRQALIELGQGNA